MNMMDALSHHGSDGSATWQCGTVGLGHQLRYVTRQSFQEVSLWSHPTAELAITADAILHNRQDLLRRLSIPHYETASWSDSQLILAAYEKWGEDCPNYLLGDFAFVIWNGRRRQLFCCRDHFGKRPLFYHYDGQRFLFASEIKGILAVAGIEKQLNNKQVAALVSPAAKQLDKATTFFEGILGIPPATFLTISHSGIQTQSYWRPDPTARLGYKRDEEVLEAFQALMFEVVSSHLCSDYPVAALLSGGLDSSAIVSVAARCLVEQGKRLITLSAISPEQSDAHSIDEREFIGQFKSSPNIEMVYITAPNRGPFDNMEQLVQGFESPLATSRHFLYTAFAEAADSRGARIILDGAGGEVGPSFHGAGFFPELFFGGRWRKLWKEVNGRSHVISQPLWRTWLSQVLQPLIKPQTTSSRQSWQQLLQPAFIDAHLDKNLTLSIKRRDSFSHRAVQYRTVLSAQKPSRVAGFSGYESIQMRFPFLDKRLLEFCLAAPADLKVRNGYARYLVRAGLQDIMPPAIQWRTSKGAFSPDYHQRYNRQKAQARAFIEAIELNDPIQEIVNVAELKNLMRHEMTNNRANTTANMAGSHLVPKGIYLICFLRQFAAFQ